MIDIGEVIKSNRQMQTALDAFVAEISIDEMDRILTRLTKRLDPSVPGNDDWFEQCTLTLAICKLGELIEKRVNA